MNTQKKHWLKIATLVSSLCAIAAVSSVSKRTHWLNEDLTAEADYQWREHIRKYGSNAMFGQWFNTNITVSIGSGTNRHDVEFGFREDGAIVWRRHGASR